MEKKDSKKIIIIIFVVVGLLALVGVGFGINAYVNLQKEQEDLKEELEEIKGEKKKENSQEKIEDEKKNEESQKEEGENKNEDSQKEEEELKITKIIPDVSGKSVSDAVAELKKAGFEVADETKEISDEKIKEGKVVKTNPPSGAKRTKGTTVTIYISTGGSKITIEDYTGKNYLEVKGALEAKGIKVYITLEKVKNPEKYESEQIIRQSVAAGEELSAGDSIELFIPDIVIEYPDFTDGTWTEKDVIEFCEKYGVKLKIIRESHSSEDGTIFYQSRNKGYTVMSGSSLTIKVSDSSVATGD